MKSILFDLYGTLVDIHTDEDSISFWKEFNNYASIYKKYDHIFLKYKYKTYCLEEEEKLLKDNKHVEINIFDVFKRLYPSLNDVEIKKVTYKFREISRSYIKLYKGVKTLLKTLKKQGYYLYILSNAQSLFTKEEIKLLNIEKFFDGIMLSSDYKIKKPNTLFFNIAIEKYSLNIEETIMIGNDYICDILPEKEVGLKKIYIQSNLTNENLNVEKIEGFKLSKILNKINNYFQQ